MNKLLIPILCTTMYYDGIVSNQTEHQKCVGHTIACFQERGIRCEDNETQVGDAAAKRPDLILPDLDTLLEVKTLKPKQRELQEAARIWQEARSGKASAYWFPEFFDRFGDDLSDSRKKFREYPDYHTAVIFYDLHSIVHKQIPEDLLLGKEVWTIPFPEKEAQEVFPVGSERKKRQLRRDKSMEIGAVVFHTERNAFKIFHNRFADPIRCIDRSIFALPEDEHFLYIDDREYPQIIPF